jgi:hypothetical protein
LTPILVALATAACATPARGATTIGSNLIAAPNGTIVGAGVVENVALPGGHTAAGGLSAPVPGVITNWALRTFADPAPGSNVRLRVLAGNRAVASGQTRAVPTTPGVTAFGERIAISAGQQIGLDAATSGSSLSVPAAVTTPGATSLGWLAPFSDGETRAPDFTAQDLEFLFQASIEPDGDADGFGDESQDGCLGQAGSRGGCPPPADPPPAPDTSITSGPQRKIKRPKARFAFESDAAGASFECALDRGGFSPCGSPKKLRRLHAGRHRFRVRAISAAGLLDRSPAEQRFKVASK